MSTSIVTRHSYETALHADSVEWCPIEGFEDILICANYKMNEATRQREGFLFVFKFTMSGEIMKLVQTLSTPGILDCKWAHVPIGGKIILAAATSVGAVLIYQLNESTFNLEEICNEKLCAPDTIILSLDWSTAINNHEHKLILSDSNGKAHLINFDGSNIIMENSWKMHEYESWIAAFNYWNTNVFLTGGDDCKLNCFDMRTDSKVFCIKPHGSGVTTMQYNYKDENTFASGSYDEKVIFWDIRQWKIPKGTVETHGGVWRVKWKPDECDILAACCMHGGSCLIHPTEFYKIATYSYHESLNYGIDWCRLKEERVVQLFPEAQNASIIAVCSFYDNLLSVATVEQS